MLHVEGTEFRHQGRGLHSLLCLRNVHHDDRASFSDCVAICAFCSRRGLGLRYTSQGLPDSAEQSELAFGFCLLILHVDIEVRLRLDMNVVARQAGANHFGDCAQGNLAIFVSAENRIHGCEPAPMPTTCGWACLAEWLSGRHKRKLYAHGYQNGIKKYGREPSGEFGMARRVDDPANALRLALSRS